MGLPHFELKGLVQSQKVLTLIHPARSLDSEGGSKESGFIDVAGGIWEEENAHGRPFSFTEVNTHIVSGPSQSKYVIGPMGETSRGLGPSQRTRGPNAICNERFIQCVEGPFKEAILWDDGIISFVERVQPGSKALEKGIAEREIELV